MTKKSATIWLCLLLACPSFCQLYVGNNAILHVSDGALLHVAPDLENEGEIQNEGTIALLGDWIENNRFNGSEGEIEFAGNEDQMVVADELVMKELIVNSSGVVTFPGEEYRVTDLIDFQFGILQTGENTRFVLDENITIPATSGSNSSYFEGKLVSKGSGELVFPVGKDGIYAPLRLLDVSGFANETEIEVTFNREIPIDPEPGDSLLGVSYKGYWELELINGVSDETQVRLDFNDEDLTDFRIFNNIRFRASTPAVAFTSSLENRWQSLGVSTLENTDSLTFGELTSEFSFTPQLNDKVYLAVGLAPTVPNNLRPFIPEVFSPNADDPDNRTFRIFGENISNENFNLQIFNKLGITVYSTNSFTEANEVGWDGTNLSGAEEPTGIYYYSVRLTFGRNRTFDDSGAFYLVR